VLKPADWLRVFTEEFITTFSPFLKMGVKNLWTATIFMIAHKLSISKALTSTPGFQAS
jgi:hypothetical protein